MNDTVLYRHIKPCGEVFYVGIGNEMRPNSKLYRNQFWHNVVNKYPDYEVQVLKKDLSWKDACVLEKILIAYYGRRDLGTGTLVNLTDGGDGLNNPSKETRQKMSAAKQNISEETRQKMSAAQRGKKLSVKTRQKLSAAQRGKKHSAETREKMSGKNNPRYGKPSPKRKLTFDQAEEIRQRYQTEKTSHRKLAQEYGVGYRTIGCIINNERYTI